MKLLGVVPLTCGVLPTATATPLVLNVATRALTLVPNGTVRAMACVPSLMMPVTAGEAI